MTKKYKIQKMILMLFVIASLVSMFAVSANAAQAVSDEAAIIYLFPDGINVPISDFGVDIDTSEYVDIDPYQYIPIDPGDALLTFNKGQLMWYSYEEGAGNYIKNVEALIGYTEDDTASSNSYLTLSVAYIEYDWTSAPNHFNVHFSIDDMAGASVVDDGTADGNVSEYPPWELWIYDTSQMKIDESNPMLFYLVTQGMLFEEKGYGRGFVNGRQRSDSELVSYYDDAYNAGYQAGIANAIVTPEGDSGLFNGLIRTVIMTPIEVVRDFLDFNILGTNVGAFVFGIVGLMIVVAVLIMVVKLIL